MPVVTWLSVVVCCLLLFVCRCVSFSRMTVQCTICRLIIQTKSLVFVLPFFSFQLFLINKNKEKESCSKICYKMLYKYHFKKYIKCVIYNILKTALLPFKIVIAYTQYELTHARYFSTWVNSHIGTFFISVRLLFKSDQPILKVSTEVNSCWKISNVS